MGPRPRITGPAVHLQPGPGSLSGGLATDDPLRGRAASWRGGPADPRRVSRPGAKAAVLEGNPGKDGPFVMRVWMPDGYRIPPHTHPKPERVTVLSGIFYVGMGDRFDPGKGKAMPAGSFGTWPAGMRHFVWARGETVIQLHGTGPWTLTYVHPEDDPRKTRK